LIPVTSLWWLKHYAEFGRHLEQHYTRLASSNRDCVLYQLLSAKDRDQNPGCGPDLAGQPAKGIGLSSYPG
jgi:hypothetical protein